MKLVFICLFIGYFGFGQGAIDEVDLIEFSNKLVYLSKFKANWYKAFQFCAQNDMRLLSIKSPKENLDVEGFLKSNEIHTIWTAGNDLGEEGKWFWSLENDAFKYTHWSRGQPTNWKHYSDCEYENCLEVGYKFHFRSAKDVDEIFWNDNKCSKKLHFICQQKRDEDAAFIEEDEDDDAKDTTDIS